MPRPPELDLAITPIDGDYPLRARADFASGELAALPFDLAALPRVRHDAAEQPST